MPGATIEVTFDDAEVRRALRRLIAAGRDMTPAMRESPPLEGGAGERGAFPARTVSRNERPHPT